MKKIIVRWLGYRIVARMQTKLVEHVAWTKLDALDWMRQYPAEYMVSILCGNRLVVERRPVR